MTHNRNSSSNRNHFRPKNPSKTKQVNESIFFLLSLPLAALLMAIMLKFVLFCHAAREEEFSDRLEAVANAKGSSTAGRRNTGL